MKKSVRSFAAFGILFTAFLAAAAFLPTTAVWAETSDEAPALTQENSWTMVVIPDPQQYTNERNMPLYQMMMNWIVENQEPLKIQEVVDVGDNVNSNIDENQWKYTSKAFETLDNKVFYILCTGNHDYGDQPKKTSNNRQTNFNKYFPADRNSFWKERVVSMGENTFGEKNLENAAYEMKTPNGQTVVTIALPFAPTDANLAWAKSVADRPEYADAFVIVITHQYILPYDRNNEWDEARNYDILKTDGNPGSEMWKKLVYPSSNIRLVLCGHHAAVDTFSNSVGFRMDKNAAGRDVAQMVFDTQALGGGWHGNGGDGWLRLLEFSADMKHVKAVTWSTFFSMSPTTRHLAREKSAYNEFEFDLN